MAKITVHGGATIGETGPEPVALPAGAEVVAAEAAGPDPVTEPVTEPVEEPASVDEPSQDEDVADDDTADDTAADADGEAEDEADAFDPSAHTVVDVNTYLETADDAERARVLAAEHAGKSRLGILNTWGAP